MQFQRHSCLCDALQTGDKIRIGKKTYTLEVADSFFSRFLGLMGRKSYPKDQALLIRPCNSIHTFFMRFHMTAVFVTDDMHIMRIVPDMPPWRMAFAIQAHAVIEITDNGVSVENDSVSILSDRQRKEASASGKKVREPAFC